VSWLLPSAIAIASAAALAGIALHFISRRRPIAEPLPTARFVPSRAVQARVAARAFSDPLLLVIRLLAIAALGAAVAGPIMESHRGKLARVVVIDRSRDVASAEELRDSVSKTLKPGDVVVLADSGAAQLAGHADVATLTTTTAPGSLSAALAGGIAAAASAAPRADSVAMVLVSPAAHSELDAATAAIRATWPALIRVVQVQAARGDTAPLRASIRAGADDALLAAASLEGLTWRGAPSAARVIVIRSAPDSDDIAWARGAGHTLVQWPSDSPPSGWTARPAGTDTVTAVAANGEALVGALRRPWRLPALLPGQRVAARWVDGEPAAIDTPFGAGCVRQVSVAFDEHSDIALRGPFRRLLRALLAPCGGLAPTGAPATASAIAMLRGAGPTLATAAPSAALRTGTTTRSSSAPWLLALGALLLIGEMALRRSPHRRRA